jgi:hypothetical protein
MRAKFLISLILFAIALFSPLDSADNGKRKACFKAPIFVYDEEQKKYYRQDWCHIGKTIIYFDSIPVPTSGEEGKENA